MASYSYSNGFVNKKFKSVELRPYQQNLKDGIYKSWQQDCTNVIGVSPTGGGKTVLFSDIVREHNNMPTCVIAHRKELVSQMALALARNGVVHRVIGPPNLIKLVIETQVMELGTSMYNANAMCAVAGVDTLIKRTTELSRWCQQVGLWVIDEAHHVLEANKWGKAVAMFPNAKGLGVTATPCRADGKGLGSGVDGVFDDMVVGVNMRKLIEMGYLTDYRIFAPPSDIDLSDVNITKTGDYEGKKLKRAVRSSHIVGDVVKHYLQFASGKQGVTFATDVETAGDIAQQFRDAGISAESVSANTDDRVRNDIIMRFRRGEIKQLVNVDLFGEGFDLPAIEVVSFARPTQSFGLYCQQFGRALRTMEGKTHAIIIDHVGNVVRHGLPDKERDWSLSGREKRPKAVDEDDDIPLRFCPECTQPYERIKPVCPYCGHKPVPAGRNSPEFVDGDLHELDPETLAEMRGAVDQIDGWQYKARNMEKAGMPTAAVNGFIKNAKAREEMQHALRESMAWWAARQREAGRTDAESYRLFYHTFGMDMLTAQALGRPEALSLANKINERLAK